MSSNVKRDHHLLTRNLKLNDNYISNDGGNEGISIDNTGRVTISNITTHASGDNYLVEDSGVIKKRTAAETLSDIGAQASLTFGISNTNVTKCGSGIVDNDFIRVDGTTFEGRSASEVLGDIGAQASLTFGIANTNAVKIDSGSVADDEYARFTANGLESRSNAEVLSDIGAIPTANLLDQDDLGDDDATKPASQQSIKAYVGSQVATKLDNNADDTMAGTLTVDKNNTATTTSSTYGLKIDYDSTGNTAISNTVSNYGLDIDLDYTGTNATGCSSIQYGINIDVNSSAGSHSAYSGTDNYGVKLSLTGNTDTIETEQYGVHSTITGGDVAKQVSFYSEAEDGSLDFKAVSSADTGDYFSIATATHGATTITTVDDDAAAANLTFTIDGEIALNGASMTVGSNVDFGDNDITNVDSLDADKFSIAGGTEMIGIGAAISGNSSTQLATARTVKTYVDSVAVSKETFSFMKRFTCNSSTSKWVGGYRDNYYKSAEVWSLSTTKDLGGNYTDTTVSRWASFVYSDFTVANACTVTKFTCSGYQNNADEDIIVGLWKVTPEGDTNHSGTLTCAHIGHILFEANADTSTMHATQSLTSFQGTTALGAGDSIMVCGTDPGTGGTDGTYWWLQGAIEVTYD
tara:strand:+ start:314 stop:2215 length:1902 start_codon:yes stop_codon:yes gene_type:complete